MADAHGSGPCESNFMEVQVLLSAPKIRTRMCADFYIFHNIQKAEGDAESMKKRPFVAFVSCILLTVCSFLWVPSAGSATNLPVDVVVSLQIDDPMMEVNGIETEIDAGRGTTPVIKNDRTLVPIRAIIEAFGGKADWEEDTKSVLLTLREDSIKLGIDQSVAYFNDTRKTLDVAPTVINDRTMLPVRFVAEAFRLGVAWDEETKTVTVVQNGFEEDEYSRLMEILPEYQGRAYTEVNQNTPFFKDYERIRGSFEYYSDLDEIGRCDVCFASVGKDLMPTEERESISSVTPTGWVNRQYPAIDGGYLYNRCHLIGFQLTGENANKRNLITGTRTMNVEGMLPFEDEIADYVESTGNHVVYRVTPVFQGSNLVADGVLLEAYSVEDEGRGISFCVFCYNVQQGITIDYATGESALNGTLLQTEMKDVVYRTPTGKRYHMDAECGGKNSYEVALGSAEEDGLTPCSKCVK